MEVSVLRERSDIQIILSTIAALMFFTQMRIIGDEVSHYQ